MRKQDAERPEKVGVTGGWMRVSSQLTCGLMLGLSLGLAAAQGTGNSAKPADIKDFVALADVINVVENVLVEVERQIETTDPQLKSAEFDFQTTTTSDARGGVLLSLVSAEAERTKTVTRETDFVYSVPAAPAKGALTPNSVSVFGWVKTLWDKLHATAKPEDFNRTLPAAIIAAAMTTRQVKAIANPGGAALSHRQFVVTLTFAVSNSFNAGGDASTLLMVAPEGRYSRTAGTTQTLKLTFEDPV